MRTWYALIQRVDRIGHKLHLPKWLQYRLCNAVERQYDDDDDPAAEYYVRRTTE